LLNDDCSPADNMDKEDIRRIIGKKYDFSDSFINDNIFSALFQVYIFLGNLCNYVFILEDLEELI
jgi:hypothetical protein